MADNNKIESLNLDLTSTKSNAMVVSALEKKGIPLSVLDVSNAWWDKYMEKNLLLG